MYVRCLFVFGVGETPLESSCIQIPNKSSSARVQARIFRIQEILLSIVLSVFPLNWKTF